MLVAYLPDAQHERENDAKVIADAPKRAEELAKIANDPRFRRDWGWRGGEADRSDPGESTC